MKVKIRFISVLFIMLSFSRLLWPSLIILPNFDAVSIFLFLTAIIIFFSIDIYEFLKKIDSKLTVRIIISLICFCLIILRFAYPEIKIDETTITLLVVAIIVLIIPDIKELLLRIRKVRKGDFEAEFGEAISRLEVETTKAEIAIERETPIKSNYLGVSDEVVQRLAEAADDPRGALLILAIEIERTIRQLGDKLDIVEGNKYWPLIKILQIMCQKGFIVKEVISTFRDFWAMRNRVIHDTNCKLDSVRVYALVDLGLRLLRLLPSDIEFEETN